MCLSPHGASSIEKLENLNQQITYFFNVNWLLPFIQILQKLKSLLGVYQLLLSLLIGGFMIFGGENKGKDDLMEMCSFANLGSYGWKETKVFDKFNYISQVSDQNKFWFFIGILFYRI